MPKFVFSGSLAKAGTSIEPDEKEAVRDYFKAYKPGQRFTVSVEKEKKPRSRGESDDEGNQDGFFFGPMMKILARDVFQTFDKSEAYYRTLIEWSYELQKSPGGGPPVKKLIHVSDMDRDQMARFIERVQMGCAIDHGGVFIPDPDPKKSARWARRFKAAGFGREQA